MKQCEASIVLECLNALSAEYEQRKENTVYHLYSFFIPSYLCATTKQSAAEKLFGAIKEEELIDFNPKQTSALEDGRLGRLYSFAKEISIFPESEKAFLL